ncbi:MAG: c-type cytochrome [Phycisphaerales bacterium]|nr:c-type cytochrome [Phycisphaerales bacterium]
MRTRFTISIAMITAVFIGACDWMPGKPTEADKPVIQSTISNFHTLWTTHCSGCHGADGRWGPARPMNDPLYLAIANKQYVTDVIAKGVNHTLMPAFAADQGGPMTSQQVKDVVDGMWEHWSNPAAVKGMSLPKLSAKPGAVAPGQKTFATYCGHCHGADGNGGKAGSVVNPTFLALSSDQALRSAIICGRIDLGMPNYAGYSGGHMNSKRETLPALNDKQISDIVAWLASHRMAYPGQPYPDTNTLEPSSSDDSSNMTP